MGGMLGYGYAGLHDDLEGPVTIGAPADLGRGFLLLRLLALTTPLTGALIDAGVRAINAQRRMLALGRQLRARAAAFARLPAGDELEPVVDALVRFNYVPVDEWLRWLEKLIARAEVHPVYDAAGPQGELALQPEPGERGRHPLAAPRRRGARAAEGAGAVRPLDPPGRAPLLPDRVRLQAGLQQHLRPHGHHLRGPGPLASVESTRSVYRAARSEYLLWRPVKGNSHIELTMGHDIRQICYDVKNLVEYARTHRTRGPSLPRLQG